MSQAAQWPWSTYTIQWVNHKLTHLNTEAYKKATATCFRVLIKLVNSSLDLLFFFTRKPRTRNGIKSRDSQMQSARDVVDRPEPHKTKPATTSPACSHIHTNKLQQICTAQHKQALLMYNTWDPYKHNFEHSKHSQLPECIFMHLAYKKPNDIKCITAR
jgi:hypothetical protein